MSIYTSIYLSIYLLKEDEIEERNDVEEITQMIDTEANNANKDKDSSSSNDHHNDGANHMDNDKNNVLDNDSSKDIL